MTLYIPEHFRVDDPERLALLIERHPFGTLVTSSAAGLGVSHVPFVVEREAGEKMRLLGHVARANGQWRHLEEAVHTLVIFQGPHAYVSPGWYSQHPAVPTWNYATVHATGRARLLDDAALHDLLLRLSAIHESGRDKPWRMSELPPAYVDSMLGMIVGFEIEVERLEGKFKLSQNRPAEVGRVVEALEREGEGELAALMRESVAAAARG
jgi:transcriptional regulator